MNNAKFKERIRMRAERTHCGRQNGNAWAGGFLLVIGVLLLAQQFTDAFPGWLFSWPVLLIAIGFLIGLRHKFQDGGWIIPVLIGSFFLVDRIVPEVNLQPYVWPAVIIAVGLLILVRSRRKQRSIASNDGAPENISEQSTGTDDAAQWEEALPDRNDVLDLTTIFGGIKKNFVSKNFKGGEIVAVMGGAEINLTQADVKGQAVIESFNMFGGTKLIVPPDWEVHSQVVTIFGGVDDKRPPVSSYNPNKVLYLDGTCIFGGIEIKSF